MRKVNLIGLLIVLCASGPIAQTSIDWLVLNDVKFEQKVDEQFGTSYDVATFGEWVKSLNGEDVFLTGYMIPMDAMGTSYALSRNPNANCFFCGGAGPETVVRLWLTADAMKRYKTDDYIRFKGRLQMNDSNEHGFIYELWEAAPVQ